MEKKGREKKRFVSGLVAATLQNSWLVGEESWNKKKNKKAIVEEEEKTGV